MEFNREMPLKLHFYFSSKKKQKLILYLILFCNEIAESETKLINYSCCIYANKHAQI